MYSVGSGCAENEVKNAEANDFSQVVWDGVLCQCGSWRASGRNHRQENEQGLALLLQHAIIGLGRRMTGCLASPASSLLVA